MKKFRELCKDYNMSIGAGVKLLISKSLKDKVLPGMEKHMPSRQPNLGTISCRMNTTAQRGRGAKAIKQVADQVIPMPGDRQLFLSIAERAYLQLMLLSIAADRPVLQRYYTPRNKAAAHWPRTTNEYLYFAGQFMVDGQIVQTKIHWNTLGDVFSQLLANLQGFNHELPQLNSTLLLPKPILGLVKVATHWYVTHYVYSHIQAYKANKIYTQIDSNKTGDIIDDTAAYIKKLYQNNKS